MLVVLSCIASQGNDFNDIDASLTSALSNMATYYDTNQLRANPSDLIFVGCSFVHRVARKRLQRHRSVTHVFPEHYGHLLRHKPTACEPFKDTGVCFPPKEPRSQTRTECSVERYHTLKHNNTSVSGHPHLPNSVL